MTGWRLSILVWSYCSNDQTEVRLWERWYLLSGTVGNNVYSGKYDIPLELNLVIVHAHCKYSTTFFFLRDIFFSVFCDIVSDTKETKKNVILIIKNQARNRDTCTYFGIKRKKSNPSKKGSKAQRPCDPFWTVPVNRNCSMEAGRLRENSIRSTLKLKRRSL